jgi:hypothetical protein
MLRSVRRKLASSISKVEEVEDFNFGSWLKIPLSEKVELGVITSRLRDTNNIKYDVAKPINTQLHFDMVPAEIGPELKAYFFGKVRSNAVFFIMHSVSNKGLVINEIEPKPVYSAKNFPFLIPAAQSKNIKVKFNMWAPVEYKSKLELPAVFDYLSEMVPKVYDVQLLNFSNFSKETRKIEIQDIDLKSLGKVKIKNISVSEIKKPKKILKVKVPSMGSFKSNLSGIPFGTFKVPDIFSTASISFQKISYWSAQFQLPEINLLKYFHIEDELLIEEQKQVPGLKDPKSVKDFLRLLLKNVQKVEWDKRKDLHIKLLPYEETGAKFLVDNNLALLQDEFGLDKKNEVIAALKFLFGNRVIKSAMIVCSPASFGNIALSKNCNVEIGWQDKLMKKCPELTFQLIAGDNDQRADLWNKSSLIYLADYETVLNDFHLKILDEKKIKGIDCLVFDEVQMLSRKKDRSREFLTSIKPRILWSVSSLIKDTLKEEINELLKQDLKIDAVKIRKKESVAMQAPRFFWYEEWLTPDEDQKKEFREGLVECQKDLRRVLESGNPFRFQANIFTLLHRLKQVSNFAPGNSASPKTSLLLEQVLTIKENGQKVIILSQYDRLGTKKIEKLFEQNKINYLLLPGGLSTEEIQKSINLFKSKPNIVALISDAKISKLNFRDFNFPYLIRFDQWWNPVSIWEHEDIFISGENDPAKNNSTTSIYNYYLLDFIDQQIKELLYNKGLLSKNIYEVMQPKVFDELISIDEWLRIFKMPASEEPHDDITPEEVLKLLNKSTLNFLRTTLSKLFFKLGYTNVDIFDLPNSSSFNIAGEAKRNERTFYLFARVYLEGNVSRKAVEEVVMESADSPDTKVFIISRGRFQEGCEQFVKENVTLLDGYSLSKLLIDLTVVTSHTADPMAELKL